MSLKKIDQAIATTKFILSKRKKKADEMSRRLDLNENQKIFIGQEYDLIKNVEFLMQQIHAEIHVALGKIPPHASDLEVQVLGACILHTKPMESAFEGQPKLPPPLALVRSFLKPEHFYNEGMKVIYTAALGVQEPSLINVVNQLRKTGQLEMVGGASEVAAITASVVSAANIEYHARVLVEMAIKRQLILLAGDIHYAAYDDTTDCFDLLENSESEFKNIRSWIK